MEISQVITGMILFALAMFISDLYNEVKKLKARQDNKTSMPKYNNPPAMPQIKIDPNYKAFSTRLIEAKDQEIKNLKAELNKVKFDYACEVAGNPGNKIILLKECEDYLTEHEEDLGPIGAQLLTNIRKYLAQS